MMKKILSIFLLIFLLISCKKEVENPSIVYAGVQNADMYTKVYSPEKEITVTFDAQNLYATGMDSIDVDNDGIFDFTFYLNYYNVDSAYLITGPYPNPVPSFKMEYTDDILVCIDSVAVYVGLGSITHFRYANCFFFEEQISFYNSWRGNNVKIWEEVPIYTSSANGEWYLANSKRYIGFHKGLKVGWIEIDITNPKKPKIVSHSIQK